MADAPASQDAAGLFLGILYPAYMVQRLCTLSINVCSPPSKVCIIFP